MILSKLRRYDIALRSGHGEAKSQLSPKAGLVFECESFRVS